MAPMASSELFCHKCGVRLPCYQHHADAHAAADPGSPAPAGVDTLHPEAVAARSPRIIAEAS
jgi:hypothetical protein